jgi:hypothetical protein
MAVYLFTTRDPQGRTVQLTEDCYRLHILVEHPDLSNVNEIAQAIRLPDYIARDAFDDNRLIYYRTYQRNPQHWLIKVVVEGEEVVTAYRVKRLKQGEMILWQR